MRRALSAVLLLAVGLSAAVPSYAQGTNLQPLALTQADVGSSLQPSSRGTGSETRDGIPAYRATFEPAGMPGPGSMLSVINLVAEPANPVVGLDEITSGMKQGLPSSATDQAPPPVGEESRAFTSSASMGPMGISMAGTTFRRNNLVVAVMVISASGTAQMDEAVRLAQVVDGRIQSSGAPAGASAGASGGSSGGASGGSSTGASGGAPAGGE
jgi:hypothetical protein